ncbi:DUF927 domain-containing protein [Silvimonas sp.]|jgi:putative DNA primase/helicase|uniref:DUF927 domain-containing protein n=1 Tax=Silvimonas sp. TaxID=2650811 RepID=UPI002844CDC4|nr:DUF927 domain-containing protein [Silvimonas sp.]MDR3428095.1 DUF927 domain-containing protein [Silvimonas sp.]
MNELSPDGTAPDPFAPLPNFADFGPMIAKIAANRAMPEIWEPQCPAPAEPPDTLNHRKHGDSVARWVYRTPDGAPIFAVYRFQNANGTKQTLPYSYGWRAWTDKNDRRHDGTGWHWKRPAAPLPLYGLDRLAARPLAPVLVCEGEKAADAAARSCPDYVAITSCGGSNSARKSSWGVLEGRTVTIWPDHDDAGADYARDVASLASDAGTAEIHIVEIPELFPPGWDLADELPEGETPDVLADLLAGAVLADPPFEMPDGFSWNKGQLYYQPPARKPDEAPPPPVFVAGQFDILGEARTSIGGEWGLFLRWRDRDGRLHEWALPKSLLHREGNAIAETLESGGLTCGIGNSHTYLKMFLSRVYPSRKFECVSRTGWHESDGKPVFVAPWSKIYGAGKSNIVLQSERLVSAESFATKGTLKQWQDELAQFAIGNDRLALFIASALAGPLLNLMGEDSGGVHLVGGSQSGKSTCAFAAGSVWGPGRRDGQVRSWRSTANGLEAIAAETSDCVLILDELGQADSKEVADIVYQLANETGKGRAGRSGEARRRQTWRSLFLSTGELTLAAKIGEAGKRTMAGLEVRLVSLPADAGASLGAFQELHGFANAREFADQIRNAARTHYGTAARAFLARLTDERAKNEGELIDKIKALRAQFLAKHCPGDADGQVKSVASRFALIACAGELARVYGVLPWTKGEALRAAGACFKAWLAERGGSGAGEDSAALAQVRGFLEAHGSSRFERLHETSDIPPGEIRIMNRAGFSRLETGELQFLIMPEAWRTEVCRGMDPKRVAAVMLREGYLKPASDGKTSQSIRIAGHSKMRLYVVSASIMGDA